MPWTHQDQLAAQRKAMEKSRFGATREEVMAVKGSHCKNCGATSDLTISHDAGGGRHATENSNIIPGKTHSMSNLSVLCRTCHGKIDGLRGSMGLGIEGNPNNPS